MMNHKLTQSDNRFKILFARVEPLNIPDIHQSDDANCFISQLCGSLPLSARLYCFLFLTQYIYVIFYKNTFSCMFVVTYRFAFREVVDGALKVSNSSMRGLFSLARRQIYTRKMEPYFSTVLSKLLLIMLYKYMMWP